MKERYVATLLGCALGDTLGMPVEGWKREQIQKYLSRITKPMDPNFVIRDAMGAPLAEDEYGKLKAYGRGLKEGSWTDDTILTAALAESLVERGMDVRDAAKRQLAAYETACRASGREQGNFGKTTTKAFQNLKARKSVFESGVKDVPGNGPAMKMSPVGLYMDATGKYKEGLLFAEYVARTTHLDCRSITAGVVQSHAVYAVLQDVKREEFVDSLVSLAEKYEKVVALELPPRDEIRLGMRFRWIQEHMHAEPEQAFQTLGNSNEVYQSYPFAMFMLQRFWDEPVEGLIETVNFGGDCDTTGAMFGSLAGARHGMVWPKEWLEVVAERERLERLGEKLHNLKKVGKTSNETKK